MGKELSQKDNKFRWVRRETSHVPRSKRVRRRAAVEIQLLSLGVRAPASSHLFQQSGRAPSCCTTKGVIFAQPC